MLLELNTISLVSLESVRKKGRTKNLTRNVLKYFLIQSRASAVLLSMALFTRITETRKVFQITMIISLMIKVASVPVHR
jgi:hypothetical protein